MVSPFGRFAEGLSGLSQLPRHERERENGRNDRQVDNATEVSSLRANNILLERANFYVTLAARSPFSTFLLPHLPHLFRHSETCHGGDDKEATGAPENGTRAGAGEGPRKAAGPRHVRAPKTEAEACASA